MSEEYSIKCRQFMKTVSKLTIHTVTIHTVLQQLKE